MSQRVVRKPPSKQTKKERLQNLRAARAAKKRKARNKTKKKTGRTRTKVKFKPKRKPAKVKTKRKPTMNKRRRVGTDVLTGGTKDVNPQYMSGTLTQSITTGYNADIIKTFNLPIVKLPSTNYVTVVELLRFYVYGKVMTKPAISDFISECMVVLYQGSTSIPGFASPRVLGACRHSQYCAWTPAGSVSDSIIQPMIYDFTDGAGHGVLVGTDKLNVALVTFFFNTYADVDWKLLFRFKNVGLEEYLGMVQSSLET